MASLQYGLAVKITRGGETVTTILFEGITDVADPAKAGAPSDTIPLHFDVPLDRIKGYAGRTAPIEVSVTAGQARESITGRHQVVFQPEVELNDLDLLDAAE